MSPLPSRTTQHAPSCALGPTSANGLFPTRKAGCFLGPRKVGGSCWATAASCPLPRRSSLTVVNRWDEKAGLRRDAVGSQVIDALEAQEIKETGNEERKSTRLNSSHLGNSYPVFCL